MSIFTFSAYSQNLPNALPDTGFVGVGTTSPTCNFQVVGQSQISGNLTVDSSITIADSANVNNNLRVSGHLFVAKNAYIADTTFSKAIRVKRITPQQGDSLIYFGDSSLVINSVSHLIYPSVDIDVPNPIKKGMGIGTENNTPKAENSVSVGHRINIDANAKNSIAIGTGVLPNGPYLQQYISNSIMLGTNSNLPTLFISPASGINTSGKVGIGTITPAEKLHVSNGNAVFDEKIGIGTITPNHKLHIATTGQTKPDIKLQNDANQPAEIIYQNGENIIGTIRMGKDNNGATFTLEDNTKQGNDKYRFVIDGSGILHFREGKVNIPAFPDYVFHSNYKLNTLGEVEKYILQNGHLPNMPNAADVEKNGIGIGEMQVKLLEKIEELTLYIIQQQKEIEILKTQINGAEHK